MLAIRRKFDPETLHLPKLKTLIGRIVEEQPQKAGLTSSDAARK